MAPAGAAAVLPFGKSWHPRSAERVRGGPMTVVAGIVALLLLGYLVVALLKPERF